MSFIKIQGWSTPRALGMYDSQQTLDIQIRAFCRTCDACARRVEWVKRRAAELGVNATWRDDESVVCLPRPTADETNPRFREEWLSYFFQADTVFVRWVPTTYEEAG